MRKMHFRPGRFHAAAVFRRFLLSWLIAVTLEYILLPWGFKDLQVLDGLSAASFLRVILVTVISFMVFTVLHMPHIECWGMAVTYTLLAIIGLCSNFTWAFLAANCVVSAILIAYATFGWNRSTVPCQVPPKRRKIWLGVTIALAILFFLFVSIWTVCRVLSFSAPTFDFGIFAQMFHNMKTTGLPLTTIERDGLLSHFHVHVSPIYYLLLPFYCLFPYPATLQVLQAAVLASAVVPLWKIGRHHGLSPALSCLLCGLLLIHPAYAGGASYDIHENAFLTPLILWLFYWIDQKKLLPIGIFGLLVLFVKEDAAVYVAVIALYYCVLGILHKDKCTAIIGISLTAVAIIWFLAVTGYLTRVGDGVMTYRYANLMYDGSRSLLSVVKAVLLNPLKALYECVDPEKLSFIGWTILPLAAIPLLTRRYERYLLLIPYILINLMSDYQYQHSLLFQYNFGSLACLIYMTAVNLADIRPQTIKLGILVTAVSISAFGFNKEILPVAKIYPTKYVQNQAYYEQLRHTLDTIPVDATVSATTFYTTYLSSRAVLYDIQYASWEHILSTDYIALDCEYLRPYQDYEIVGGDGFTNFYALLEAEGYVPYAQLDDAVIILTRG